jgi:hypothetical protein
VADVTELRDAWAELGDALRDAWARRHAAVLTWTAALGIALLTLNPH